MHKGATLEGARSLFATIMAPEVNAHIGEQLPQLLASTVGLSLLDGAVRQSLARMTDRRLDGVSDTVAAQTGVPAQSAHALTGIVGATLLWRPDASFSRSARQRRAVADAARSSVARYRPLSE